MFETQIFDSNNKPSDSEKESIINFLHKGLEEYGDPKKDIKKAMDYSTQEINLLVDLL